MSFENVLSYLPYQKPFLFVDGLLALTENSVTGHYTFRTDEYFYKGHFKEQPVTPGVILTECMAQIGVVCLGIYLMRSEISNNFLPQIALTSSQVDYYIPVFPGEKVTVHSEKEVFRFNKLKCKVKMYNDKKELVCRGLISGMIKSNRDD